MLKQNIHSVLIIQTAFIGDAILASSVVEKLHAFYPDATIDVLVRKGNESLYHQHPFLGKVLVWNKKEGKYKSLIHLLKRIRSKKYDMVVNLHRFASSGFLTAFSGSRYKVGYDKNPLSFLFTKKINHVIGNGRHEVERYNDLIEDITDNSIFKPKLYPSEKYRESVKQYKTSSYVCIAPSSVWFTKQLPESKWTELCNLLKNKTIYLLGAQTDRELCERIKSKAIHQQMVILAGQLSFLESCALMQDADMNYVNDSAPLHLASSVNAPVTAFFCSTVPAFGFGPLSDISKIIETNESLTCKPCGLHGYNACPKQHFKCGSTIDVSTSI